MYAHGGRELEGGEVVGADGREGGPLEEHGSWAGGVQRAGSMKIRRSAAGQAVLDS